MIQEEEKKQQKQIDFLFMNSGFVSVLTEWRNSVQMIQLFSSSFPVFQSI